MNATTAIPRDSKEYKAIACFIHYTWGSVGKDGTTPPFFPGPQPISIERKHMRLLKSRDYLICEKTDGTRFALVCLSVRGKKMCVMVNRAMEMYSVKIHMPPSAYQGTILDGEYVEGKTGKFFMMIYDGVMVSNVLIKDMDLSARLASIRNLTTKIMKTMKDPFTVKLKTFYAKGSFQDLADMITSDHFGYKNDGLVFTPVQDPVRMGTHETMFKWKPRHMNTIDFLVKNRDNGGWGLYIQERGELIFASVLDAACVPKAFEHKLHNGAIAECEYKHEDWPTWWNPVGIRTDKTHPNNRRTMSRTLVNIQENIKIAEFISLF